MEDSGAEASTDSRRILIFGWGPLPFEDAQIHYAPCARLWQIARALSGDGHELFIVAPTMPGAAAECETHRFERGGIRIIRCEEKDLNTPELQTFIREAHAEIIVGITPRPASWAIPYAAQRPLFIDLFGDLMSEAQARDLVIPGADRLRAYRDLLAELLDAGDAFSTVSRTQSRILVGQLGLAGRFTAATAQHPCTSTERFDEDNIPCGIPIYTIPCSGTVEKNRETFSEHPLPGLPADAIVALSSGGFNTWLDVETLFEGMESAMDQERRLHFALTGGSIPGQDENSFSRWEKLIRRSRHPGRYRMLGFVSSAHLASLIEFSDFGLVAEKDILERRVGSSGRMAHWLGAGLPVICTSLSELGREIGRRDMGKNYLAGDATDLARVLVEMVADRESLDIMARKALSYARKELSPKISAGALRRWVAEAKKLPGSRERAPASLVRLFDEISDLEDERNARDRRIVALQAELGEIHHSRMWALWMRYLKLRKSILGVIGRG